MIQSVLSQLNFSFHRHQPIRADFSGGQITSDAGLLPLRAFDQRHDLTGEWASDLSDPRQNGRLRHDSLALLGQRIYQIVAGYEDAWPGNRRQSASRARYVFSQGVSHVQPQSLSRVIDSSSHPKSHPYQRNPHRAKTRQQIAKWMEKESKKLREAIYGPRRNSTSGNSPLRKRPAQQSEKANGWGESRSRSNSADSHLL